ncbi:MAG TPA: GAF domain-containing protein [Opitutaceae bacterium]|nr:GAF domain-containing protein [Opitutaceae bacterium]
MQKEASAGAAVPAARPPDPGAASPGLRLLDAEDPRLLPVLPRIAALVAGTEEPPAAMRAILGELTSLFHATSGSIALFNPDTGRLETEIRQGLPADAAETALRPGQGITGWVAFHGRPLLVPDVTADPRYLAVRPGVRCEMAAPMEAQGQVVGVINLDGNAVGSFTPADLALLVRLTAEATSGLQRLWQLRQLQGKARQLEALITIGQSLVSKLEEQELFDTVTREARQIMSARLCALYLHDSSRRMVRPVSFSRAAPPDPAAATGPAAAPAGDLPLEHCLIASVLHTRRQIEFHNVQSPEYADVIDLPHGEPLDSLLAAPLLFENEAIGVLAVFTEKPHRFNNDEKRLVGALASLAAVAIQNSRLYTRVFQSEESLRKSERLTTLGLLAAEIAHEIRNPLTVIKLLYGHLGLDFPEGDPRRKDTRVISEKLDQLEAIVTRVLSFAQTPSSLHARWSVAEIIEDTIVLIRLKLAQSKIRLHFAPPAPPFLVDGHKGQLQQVMLNLLLNAMQVMPEGGEITVRCAAGNRGGAAVVFIDITDTGGGIPEAIRGRIFDSFLTGRPDGTGLGLAIVERILRSHHGEIGVLATSPQGTTMRVTLPLARP